MHEVRFVVEIMPIEKIQELRSFGAWNVSFLRTVCVPAYKVAKVAGPEATFCPWMYYVTQSIRKSLW